MSGRTALEGRSVLVTGGNGGIGLAIGHAVGRAGARVMVWGRNEEKNASAVQQLRAEGITADAFQCDVTDEAQVQDTFDRTIDVVGGRVDTVFANAGSSGFGVDFLDLTLDQWRGVLAANLDGAFVVARTAARHMVEQRGGALVFVSSTSAIHGAANNEAYGAAKTALLGLNRALAVRLARHAIRVNALLPGWTLTEQTSRRHADERFRDITTRRTPARRWASPDDMGAAAVYLADPNVTFHTGDSLVVDGGYTIF